MIPHPWTDHPGAGWLDEGETSRRTVGAYLAEGRFSEELPPGAPPSRIRHIGWHHRTLASWFTLVAEAGFTLAEVTEPAGTSPERPDHGGPWQATPRFLAFRARRS